MSDIGVLFFVPPLLRRLQAIAPSLQVEIVATSETGAQDFAPGRPDLAIGSLRAPAVAARTPSVRRSPGMPDLGRVIPNRVP